MLNKRFSHFQKVNPALIDLFNRHMDKQNVKNRQAYASHDRLLAEYPNHPELGELAQFIKDSVFELAAEVNGQYWGQRASIEIFVTGIWFQISNNFNFHETHTHGNCSWSGVYYVQSGNASKGPEDHPGKQPNGITRFYGPGLDISGGGHGEAGNVYLHDYAYDSYPQDGKLVIFPAHLKHMVFPYNGERDRVVVSFHVQIKNSRGDTWNYAFS